MFKYAFILTQKTAHSDNKSHPSEVRRKSPGAVLISFFIILYHSYIVLISFIHPHAILQHCLSHWQKSTVDQLSGRETLS